MEAMAWDLVHLIGMARRVARRDSDSLASIILQLRITITEMRQ